VTSTETISLRAAARNNAEWCASLCRSHGIPGAFGETAWTSARRTPPYYPDVVTLRDDAVPGDFLPGIDTESPGCSVKDSFATLDLTPHGFAELFTAQWIHRPAGLPAPETPGLRGERVTTAARLHDWQTAWHGGDGVADIFRPALLEDPSVLVLAVHDGEEFAGGAVLNRGAGLVGLTNLFAVDGAGGAAVRSSVLTAAAGYFPGLPLVGYEHGDDLGSALASGFAVFGTLRVWLHAS
jgi:hypothetical protein